MSGGGTVGEGALTRMMEIPKGSRNKNEYDPELDCIKLDRFLSASVVYPTAHGFVPETLAPDGDPLDVLVCVSEPTVPGSTVVANPIGLFKMADVQGPDHHVVCVPCHDAGWDLLADVADLPAQLQAEVAHFFSAHKDVNPTKPSKVNGFADRAAATSMISEPRSRFRRQHDDDPKKR
jgi:inorganic pyrophosphatase